MAVSSHGDKTICLKSVAWVVLRSELSPVGDIKTSKIAFLRNDNRRVLLKLLNRLIFNLLAWHLRKR